MSDSDRPDIEELEVARLLQAVGRREELPEHLQQNWETHFRGELQHVAARRRRQRNGVLAVCAGLLVAVIAGLASWQQLQFGPQQQVVARVTHVAGSSHSLSGQLSPEVGHHLVIGSRLATGAASWIAIAYGNYDLRLNSDTHIELAADQVRLLSGEIYVSDAGKAGAGGITIATRHGTVRDIGTQFAVRTGAQRTTTRVRRGEIVVTSAGTEHRAEAVQGSAREVSFSDSGELRSKDIPAHGAGWQWIYQGMPAFELEGKSAYEFLDWSAAETGLQLRFATRSAEIYARTTLLHGDIRRLTPLSAIEPVLATTDLRATQTSAGLLRIELPPAHLR